MRFCCNAMTRDGAIGYTNEAFMHRAIYPGHFTSQGDPRYRSDSLRDSTPMPEPLTSDKPTAPPVSMPGARMLARHFALPCVAGLVATLLVFDPLYRLVTLLLLLPLYLHAAASVWWPEHQVQGRAAVIQRCFRMVALMVTILGWGVVFIVLGYVFMSLFTNYALNNNTLLVIESLTPLGFMLCAWFWWPAYARDVVPSWPDDGIRIRVLTSTRWQKELMTIAQHVRRTAALPQYHGFLATSGLIIVVAVAAIVGIFSGFAYRLLEIALLLALVPLHLIVVSQAEVVSQLWQKQATRLRSREQV